MGGYEDRSSVCEQSGQIIVMSGGVRLVRSGVICGHCNVSMVMSAKVRRAIIS